MMEAARTSETLVNFYQTTRCYNPEDSHLHPRRQSSENGLFLLDRFPINFDNENLTLLLPLLVKRSQIGYVYAIVNYL
jgi:hypothetical protein